VGADTSAKLRAAAKQYLVPYHEAAGELARAATRGKPLRERGPRIRLETRLDPTYQEAMRSRGRRSAEIMRDRLNHPDQRDRLREQLRLADQPALFSRSAAPRSCRGCRVRPPERSSSAARLADGDGSEPRARVRA
jgi:hypothetical protein